MDIQQIREEFLKRLKYLSERSLEELNGLRGYERYEERSDKTVKFIQEALNIIESLVDKEDFKINDSQYYELSFLQKYLSVEFYSVFINFIQNA